MIREKACSHRQTKDTGTWASSTTCSSLEAAHARHLLDYNVFAPNSLPDKKISNASVNYEQVRAKCECGNKNGTHVTGARMCQVSDRKHEARMGGGWDTYGHVSGIVINRQSPC